MVGRGGEERGGDRAGLINSSLEDDKQIFKVFVWF